MQQNVPAGLLAKPAPAPAPAPQSAAAGEPGQIDPLAAAIAQAVNSVLAPVLTQMLPAILGDTLRNAMPRRDKCAECVRARLMWSRQYEAEIQAAHVAACTASQIAPEDPRAVQVNATAFLPEQLRPGAASPSAMPPMHDSVTTDQGQAKCAEHLMPEAAGRRPFLVVNGPVTSAMLGQLQ